MNIYSFMNSIPDYVSNPLTAINAMIMISGLKDKFGDKIHETTYEGYLAIQDMSPYKYYKLCLWYWCDECTYGIRECTAKDFNIKEEDEMDVSKMSKEEALRAIDDLKEYVEKCEEKEKEQEIPEMVRKPINRDQNAIVCPQIKNDKITAWLTFEKDVTSLCWAALAYELAQLMYAREYLGVELIHADQDVDNVYRLVYDGHSKCYKINYCTCIDLCEDDILWFFKDRKDAERVRDYMNTYVMGIK